MEKIRPIEWNEEAFANLVLPSDRKMLLQSLVEAHNAELSGFDDFIKGKGRGLVVNLFGPPGVGKTLSAEATSEREVHNDLMRDNLQTCCFIRCQAAALCGWGWGPWHEGR